MREDVWSKEEDDVLRRKYATLRKGDKAKAWGRLLALLPKRSKAACLVRASKLRLAIKAHWTAQEDAVLTTHYTESAVRTIRKLLPGRSWVSIQVRARKLGVSKGRWQGFVSVTEAARRLNFSTQGFRRIAQAVGVPIHVRASGTSSSGAKYAQRVVEWDLAEEGVRRWLDLETVRDAAKRYGLRKERVERWLREERGPQTRPFVTWRLRPQEFDEVINNRLKKEKKNG